jgi:hypothetical protein
VKPYPEDPAELDARLSLWTVIGIVLLILSLAIFAPGCAFNKVELGNHTGTNTTTAVVRSYAIWPATVGLDKQKASAGKTLSIGTEGLEASGGGTNLTAALAELRGILQLIAK